MGSMVHASQCVEKKENISLMISLDMIGFAGIFLRQDYPLEDMKETYPATGNFLAVAALPSNARYAMLFRDIYNRHSRDKIHDIIAPASIEGINLSDHMSFHRYGFPSIVLSDTGAYRNRHYHTENDTEPTINYPFLANNVRHIATAIRELANSKKIP